MYALNRAPLYALLATIAGSQGLAVLDEMPEEYRAAYLDHVADAALAFDMPDLADRIRVIESDADAASCLQAVVYAPAATAPLAWPALA